MSPLGKTEAGLLFSFGRAQMVEHTVSDAEVEDSCQKAAYWP